MAITAASTTTCNTIQRGSRANRYTVRKVSVTRPPQTADRTPPTIGDITTDADPDRQAHESDEAPPPTWDDADEGTPRHPPRWVLAALVTPIVGLIVANNVGAILFTRWLQPKGSPEVVLHPLGILALNSTNKMLLATGFSTATLWFVVVATLRLLAPDPLFYLLGFLYRRPAIRWGRRVFPGSDRLFDLFEHEDHAGVRRLLDVLVFVMPNNPVSLLAGVAGMPWKRFLAINLAGTLGRVALFKVLSEIFEKEVSSIMSWVASYQRWALLAVIVAVVISLSAMTRRVISSTEELAEEV